MSESEASKPVASGAGRHFLEVDDLSAGELAEVLSLAGVPPRLVLAGRGVALLMEKPSARTRSATEVAVAELGGHPVTIREEEVGLDRRESVEDVARTLGCYHAALCARVRSHSTLERMAGALDAAGAGVPVVNLLSDRSHPTQALADILTLRELLGTLDGRVLAFVGDGGNNVCRSLVLAGAMAGLAIRVASPRGYGLDPAVAERAAQMADVRLYEDPAEAVAGADAVYTDVWTSMGQEEEAEARRASFAPFMVNAELMRHAPGALVLHCLPAHRGEEIAAEVLDGPRSVVWRQAANRLHAMRGLLLFMFGRGARR